MKSEMEKIERKLNILEVLLGSMAIMTIISVIFGIWFGMIGVKVSLSFLIITCALAIYTAGARMNFDAMKAKSKVKDEEIDKAAELLSQICQGYDRCFAEECPLIGNASTCKAECDKKEEWYNYLKGNR